MVSVGIKRCLQHVNCGQDAYIWSIYCCDYKLGNVFSFIKIHVFKCRPYDLSFRVDGM